MAKTIGKINGTAIGISADGVTITCSTSATLTITNETRETTCKDDDGATTYEPAAQTWSMTLDGLTKYDTASNYSTVAEFAKSREIVTWVFKTMANPDDPYWQGDGFIGSFTQNAGLNETSDWSIEVQPTGPIYLFNT
jgi:hypothetical protein